MKHKSLLIVSMAVLLAACATSPKQAVEVPVSTLDVEQLINGIDYDMDISALPLADIRVLRNAPAALRGYPFKDAYLRGIYQNTTWYDSLTWKFDGAVNYDAVEEREGENWRDHYYRAVEKGELLKYTAEELAFMQRLKEREDELLKLNFAVEEPLRVNMQNLVNPAQLKDFDSLLCQQLAQVGFAIVPATHEQLFHVYEQNDYNEFPSFVTTDLFLQLYHLYFDCMLREVEERHLMQLMTDFSHDMYAAMRNLCFNTPPDSESSRIAYRNAQFFNIAWHLFTGKPIVNANDEATEKAEIEHVMATENAPSALLMDYQGIFFPYSLFRPRGHYTRSDALQRYFRGMMWLQTASLGMDHKDEVKMAVVMAYVLNHSTSLQAKYDKLNNLITFLMGKPDNLSMSQVQAEVTKTGIDDLVELLYNEEAMAKITATLNDIGNKQTRIRPKFERTSHNKICVMPQRYQPDAEVLLEMVDYDSKTTQRGTPKGLDVFAAMGVSPAEQILIDEGQKWKGFDNALDKMKQRMHVIDWKETIATQWMNTLRTISDKPSDKAPYFMLTPEWERKNLNAMLASWAELKHDAILYAKQPMGAECGGGGLPDPVVKGYVEPNVSFWKKAIELLDNTARLLKQEKMMTEKVEQATTRIREEAEFLLRISEKQLAGQQPTDEEYDQLSCVGATFENISLDLVRQPDQYLMGWSDVQGADRKVALVADVYTANADNNPQKSILFEAVGAADEIYVVVEIGGCLYLTRGAVLSYREFTQPIDQQRLTDEEWQKQLEKEPRKGVPAWMTPLFVPLKNQPVPNEEFFYSSGC